MKTTKEKVKKHIKRIRLMTNTCLTAEHLLMALIDQDDENIRVAKDCVESIYKEFGIEAMQCLDSIIIDKSSGIKSAKVKTNYVGNRLEKMRITLDDKVLMLVF